jgi:hypothetical protein
MGLRHGKAAAKGKVLAVQVAGPQAWKEFLVTEHNIMRRKEQRSIEETRYYRGELINIHGEEEFKWLLEKGKLKEIRDEQGDECYIKTVHKEKTQQEHLHEAHTTKKGVTTAESLTDLNEASSLRSTL